MVGLGMAALAFSSSACADPEAPSATPFRPTVTSGASLSAPGWLELEMGGQRQGANGFDARTSVPYLLKYALNDRFALLLGGDGYVGISLARGGADVTGRGDTATTLKYLAPDAIEGTSFGLEASVKFPSVHAAPWHEVRRSVVKRHPVSLPNPTRLGASAPLTG